MQKTEKTFSLQDCVFSEALFFVKGRESMVILIVESWLLVLYAKLAVNSCDDALNLTECEHTTEESVAGVVTLVALVEHTTRLVCECHAVVNTHRKTTTAVALSVLLCLLEDAAKLDEVATTAKVRSLCEVSVREDMA